MVHPSLILQFPKIHHPNQLSVQVETEAVAFLLSSTVAVAKPAFTQRRRTVAIKHRLRMVLPVALVCVRVTKLRSAFEARVVDLVVL